MGDVRDSRCHFFRGEMSSGCPERYVIAHVGSSRAPKNSPTDGNRFAD
jgi:hypothetical protein